MMVFSKSDFLERLNAFGADFNRWPEAERTTAEAFLEVADDDIKAAYLEELAFDAFIAPAGNDPEVCVDLETSLLAHAPAPSSHIRKGGLLGWLSGYRAPRWASATLAALCLVGGAGTGYGVSLAEKQANEADIMLAFAVVSTPTMIEEWTKDSEAMQ